MGFLAAMHKIEEKEPDARSKITNFIEFGDVHSTNYFGSKVSAIRVTIPGISTIDLGWLESQIYPK